MYDQLAVLAPIMLSFTAASPIFKGRLSDVDCRWNVIAQSVDDRTPAERGLVAPECVNSARKPGQAGDAVARIPKSRYDSVYLHLLLAKFVCFNCLFLGEHVHISLPRGHQVPSNF
jgi:glutamate--cysteine ligase catalytic subunit